MLTYSKTACHNQVAKAQLDIRVKMIFWFNICLFFISEMCDKYLSSIDVYHLEHKIIDNNYFNRSNESKDEKV